MLRCVIQETVQLLRKFLRAIGRVDTYTFGTASSLNSDNLIPVRSNGRYHKVRLNLSGEWKKAQGIDVDFGVMGRR